MDVPLLFTGAEYEAMARRVVTEWKRELIRIHGPTAPDAFRAWMKERKASLFRRSGESDSGELQSAFMLPQYIENKIAAETKDPDWPRSFPRLLRAVYNEFSDGAMGEYTNAAGTGKRDFGLSLGSGDKD